jgi:hypothetical protein
MCHWSVGKSTGNPGRTDASRCALAVRRLVRLQPGNGDGHGGRATKWKTDAFDCHRNRIGIDGRGFLTDWPRFFDPVAPGRLPLRLRVQPGQMAPAECKPLGWPPRGEGFRRVSTARSGQTAGGRQPAALRSRNA